MIVYKILSQGLDLSIEVARAKNAGLAFNGFLDALVDARKAYSGISLSMDAFLNLHANLPTDGLKAFKNHILLKKHSCKHE